MNRKLYEKGQKLRGQVLGPEYVERAAKNTDDFNRPFQEWVAEHVWGTLWSRKGLDWRTRAVINLAVLTALGRTEEVKIYLRAGPKIGLTKDEIREVLLHTAIYCGYPAAVDSFRAAKEVFGEAHSDAASEPAAPSRKKAKKEKKDRTQGKTRK